jgi:predicted nucleic acid-binding protein
VIVGVDTDVLVAWTIRESPFHQRVRRWLRGLVAADGLRLGLTPQVGHEWLHVVTDPRRFAAPPPLTEAVEMLRGVWESQEVVEVLPGPRVLARTLDLLRRHRLGRKRILDTALAATLENAGIERLATFNGRDYRVFPFLEPIEPG